MRKFNVLFRNNIFKCANSTPQFNLNSSFYENLKNFQASSPQANENYSQFHIQILKFIEKKEETIPIFQTLLLFFDHFQLSNSEPFTNYLSIYHYFFKAHQKISLKSLSIPHIIILIDLIYKHPDLLKQNNELFNFLDIYLLNYFKKPQTEIIPSDSLLKALVLAMKLNKGSKNLFHYIETNINFTNISTPNLILMANTLSKSEKFSRIFTKQLYQNLIIRDFSTIKLVELCELLYSTSLLNFSVKELFQKSFEMFQGNNFVKNNHSLKLLWVYMYYSLRFPEDKLEEAFIENVVKGLNPTETIKNGIFSYIQAYKTHEIELFLSVYHNEIYKKHWKLLNNIKEENYKGGIDKLESLLQNDVKIILNVAGIPFEMEKRIEKIYIIDFFIPEKKGVLLEINGPKHYFFNAEEKGEIQLNGKSFVKSEILKSLGYKFVNISYKEWYDLKGVNAKINFLSEKVYGLS